MTAIDDAVQKMDDLTAELKALGYKYLLTTDLNLGDDVYFEITVDGLEATDNESNPGVMPRFSLALSVKYTHDFLEQNKRLLRAMLGFYPRIVAIAFGQIDDEVFSYFPDPDAMTRPDRIGITFRFTYRDGLVSYKD